MIEGLIFIMIKDVTSIGALSEKCHCEWRISSKTQLTVTHFLKDATVSDEFANANGSDVLRFVDLKIIFISLIFNNLIILIIKCKKKL
jgi:hypothetical protein